jgi:hypothetical protein
VIRLHGLIKGFSEAVTGEVGKWCDIGFFISVMSNLKAKKRA